MVLAAAFSFGGAGVLALMTGNITLYLHLALIGSVLIYLQGRRAGQRFLMLAVFSCSLLVKPYFLIYALPLLLIDRFSWRATGLLAVSILVAVAVYLLFWLFDKSHSLLFIEALRTLGSGTDLGESFFGLAAGFVPKDLALKIHVAIAAALALAVVFLRRLTARFAAVDANDGALFLLAYSVITLCNPRMKEYDLVPALICLYFYLCCHGLFGRSLILLSLLVAQLPLWVVLSLGVDAAPEVFTTLAPWQMAGVLLPLAVFVATKAYCAASGKAVPVTAN